MSKRNHAATSPAESPVVAAARERAELAYWNTVADVQEKQRVAMASYDGAISGGAGYSGGVQTRVDESWQRNNGDLYVGEGGVRQQPYESLRSLRDRSRNLERNNLLACGVLDRVVENVVGTTFRIEPKSSSPEFNAAARLWWKRWAHTTACDVRGRHTFGALLRLAYRAKTRDGDVGIVLAMTGDEEGSQFPPRPRLQIIEPERICSPRRNQYTAPDGNQIVDGVEMNSYGRAVAYWVGNGNAYGVSPVRIDARDFIFFGRSNRYGDTRGEPGFTGGFGLFGQIMGYLEAAVIASRVGASAAMIAKKRDPNTARLGLGAQTVGSTNPAVKPTIERILDVQPGGIHFLNTDEDLVPFNPAQPQQQLPDAIATFARFVGVKFGLTIEQVLLDFSRTTFSSGKMAKIQAEATAEIEQEDLATNVVSRIYQWALSKAVQLGEITTKPPADFWTHEWIPSRRPSPQPDKDLDVAERSVRLGVDARGYIAKSLYGYEFGEVCQQNKADREMMIANGLPLNDDNNNPGLQVDESGNVIVTNGGAGKNGQQQQSPTALNGIQVTAAMEVLSKLVEKSITGSAAVELWTALGIDRDKAASVVKESLSRTDISPGDLAFQRSYLLKLMDVQGAKQVLYNISDIPGVASNSGIPLDKKVQTSPDQGVPLLPVTADAGPLVSGAAINDPQGDLVGGDVENKAPADGPTDAGGTRNTSPPDAPPSDAPPKETP